MLPLRCSLTTLIVTNSTIGCNLRLCTHTQNQHNKDPITNVSSKYKGVSWHKSKNKWRAVVYLKKRQIYLGRFDSEIDAAIAYNNAAIKYFGDFARLNTFDLSDCVSARN